MMRVYYSSLDFFFSYVYMTLYKKKNYEKNNDIFFLPLPGKAFFSSAADDILDSG